MGDSMNTYKEIVKEKNAERKEVISNLMRAVALKDEKSVERLTLKMGIYASKPTDVGFSIHDLRTFLHVYQNDIKKCESAVSYFRSELNKINRKIGDGKGVSKQDKEKRNILFSFLRCRIRELNDRSRVEKIILEQLDKRHYTVFVPEYQCRKTTVAA